MDATERAHIENLLKIDRAHLRELEMQQAKLGILAPSGVAVQIEEYRKKIDELDRRLNAAMPRHNLPPRDYERFVGRQNELEDVRRLLLPYPKSRHHLVTIDGIGGIGKSALALETAYQARERYASLAEAERFEAIVWVSAKRTYLTADGILEHRQSFRTLDDLYAAIAQVLEFPAITRAPAAEQRAIVEQVLAEQRTLLILDNLETVNDEELLVFLRLLPDPTKAIVTTRHRIDVAYPVRLLGMPHDDALRLIALEAARKGVTLADDEPEQLFARTGGLPLAIVWSIGLMGLGGSVESVLRRLSQGQSDIARFCFAESAAQIRGRDAHKLLLALGLFAADASREALGVVAGIGEDEFGRDMGLEELLRLSLVNKEGDRFSLLPLTRSFVVAEATKQADWVEGAQNRMQQYFSDLVSIQGGWSKDWRGHDRVERDLENIFTVIDSLFKSLRYQQTEDRNQIIAPKSRIQARKLLDIIYPAMKTCRLRGYWREAEHLCEICLEASRALRNIEDIGWSCYHMSKLYFLRNDADSMRRSAIEAFDAGQRTGVARLVLLAQRQISAAAVLKGDLAEAIAYLPEDINAGDEEKWPLRYFYRIRGNIAQLQGNLKEAAQLYQQSYESFKRTDNLPSMAADLLKLGIVMQLMGDVDSAEKCYTEGLRLGQECGRTDVIGSALLYKASIESERNLHTSAESNARQALDLFRRLGMKREQADAAALLERLEAEA